MQKFNTVESCLDYYISNRTHSIYPETILKHVNNITVPKLYVVCNKYESENKIKSVFEIHCPECFSIIHRYTYYGDIPETSECPICKCDNIDRDKNIRILYLIRKD